jgi:serine/threonine protein kinase
MNLKPEDVLLGRRGRVKVLDFGLAEPLETAPPAGTAPPPLRPSSDFGGLAHS